MNTYYIKDQEFLNSKIYQDYLKDNPSEGMLRVRAFAANQAVPVKGMEIIVSTVYENSKIIFYDGLTNESGVVENINLPAPKLNPDNLDAPNAAKYDIEAKYVPDNIDTFYKVNIYEDICVVQNISVVPKVDLNVGGFNGR
ncbi:MAG: hypothetical protein IJ574_02275 [Bacilli bacterium]|nr:hypothetical protein [Bacilli bacterium]